MTRQLLEYVRAANARTRRLGSSSHPYTALCPTTCIFISLYPLQTRRHTRPRLEPVSSFALAEPGGVIFSYRGWLSDSAHVAAVKRRVYLLGLPLGVVSAALLWATERANGTLHIIDRVGLPLLGLVMLALFPLVWQRRGQLFVLELVLFLSFSAMILASLGYSIFELPTEDVTNLTGLGYWTTVLSTLAFLIFGVRTGLKISLLTYAAAVGIWLTEIALGGNSTAAEYTVLFQLYSSNAVQLLLLYGFGVLVQTQTQQAARLGQDANTDALTGLPNRRCLQGQLEGEVERSARYGRVFSVALLDLDHFKRINDTFGHGVGDLTLKEVAGLLGMQARTLDTAGRWGGEEFLLLLPELSLSAASEVAERFRVLIETHTFGHGAPLTASFGVAEYQAGETLVGLLERADQALYGAKERGRNRVGHAHPVDSVTVLPL